MVPIKFENHFVYANCFAVSRYEVTDVKVVFYLRRITQSPLTLEFDLRQNIQVNRPQPARIYVYDYYKTSVMVLFKKNYQVVNY